MAATGGRGRRSPRCGSIRLSIRGRLAEAVALLEEGVTVAPSDASAHYALGVAYAQAGRIEPAVTALERAAALAPDDLEVRQALAVVSARTGRRRPSGTDDPRGRR